MSQELQVLAISAIITAGIQLCGFAVAFALKTETFYDILGGINFLTIAIYSAIDGQNDDISFFDSPRKASFTILFLISRFWLLLFLAWRAHERKGDSRFDEIKYNFASFLIAWMFQGVWVFTISLPVIFVNGSDNIQNDGLTVLEYVTIVGFGLGVFIEIIADIQKAAWVKNGRVGTFCTAGVWKYSRHPNYFGEIFQWWCAWIFAYGSSTGPGDVQWWCSVLSPVMTMLILLFTPATGVMNANGSNLKRYYDKCPVEYAKYRKETSILIPLPCGLYKFVPMFLKRTLFFDLKKYEYSGEISNVPASENNENGKKDTREK
mmetsp:Transcript_19584/g.29335  ORF Transcript_19584/g.29335 Transcript_19584/m.29335 type:complete len:320 (-) Transcript_19584:203-1162(-)|eukprot:CAMPEP_0203662746 /NCGR_PEP_ID=MMETSP0090-20130426/605_1 /ASSEMBLY_ACC=CAM_ASM_001088 /TAXON_ID=426623 /ORGANISM="Chaetoceros affinis, Strain CCMP159" /LENGTH=319 /DNA_ID=CAMNT_0050525577 /DNA_START=38 /DNA_END=997 /DNA_ORIENTATION=+